MKNNNKKIIEIIHIKHLLCNKLCVHCQLLLFKENRVEYKQNINTEYQSQNSHPEILYLVSLNKYKILKLKRKPNESAVDSSWKN